MEPASRTQLVQVFEGRGAGRAQRRSSVSLTQAKELLAPMAAASGAVSMAGRPHFLKERCATMIDLVPTQQSTTVQSKAGMFLVGLVDKAHALAPVYEPKPSSSLVIHDARHDYLAAQTRRNNVVLKDGGAGLLQQLGIQPRERDASVMASRNGTRGSSYAPAKTRIPSGYTQEEPRELDEPEPQTPRTMQELARDLALYKKDGDTQVAILNEMHARLVHAQMQTGEHEALSRELVEEGLLPTMAGVMREFRFHVALQTAAIAVLAFLADVSDLYGYMMSEIDLELLVQKVVAVHVTQERLVMTGSALHHAISESRRKASVVQLHRAREAEKEKRRVASFAQAVAAEISAASKSKAAAMAAQSAARARSAPLGETRIAELQRPTLRLRSALAAELGAPPVLSASYQLDLGGSGPSSCSSGLGSARRAHAVSPLRSPACFSPTPQQLDELDVRPMTSPEPLARGAGTAATLSLASASDRISSSSAGAAAVYARSPVFVAPSPLSQRMRLRKTHSAAVLKRKPVQAPRAAARHRCAPPRLAAIASSAQQQNGDDGGEQDDATVEKQEANSEGEDERSGPEHEDSEPEYDADFEDEAHASRRQLLLADSASDSELLDLVAVHAATTTTTMTTTTATPADSGRRSSRLVATGSDSELIEMIHARGALSTVVHASAGTGDIDSGDGSHVVDTADKEQAAAAVCIQRHARGMLTRSQVSDASVDRPPKSSHHADPTTEALLGMLRACVDESAVSTSARPQHATPESTRSGRAGRRHGREPPARSPQVAAWTPPMTIVRPVSRRIMDKTLGQTTRRTGKRSSGRAATSDLPSTPTATVEVASITGILRQIDNSIDQRALELPGDETGSDRVDSHGDDVKDGKHADGILDEPSTIVDAVTTAPFSSSTTADDGDAIAQIQALYARGLQLHKTGALAEAATCYERALDLQRASGTTREFASLHINLGSAWMAAGRIVDALAAFVEAERIQPRNPKAAFNAALALLQLGRADEAVLRLERVLALDPGHMRARAALAQCRQESTSSNVSSTRE